MEKKPWYKSKIFVIAVIGIFGIVANYVTGFISGSGVTQEQIDAVNTIHPTIATAIQDAKSGQNIFQVVYGAVLGLIGVWRLWFTTKTIK